MKLIDFLTVIAGLVIGVGATGSIFGIGHVFIEDVFSGEKPDMFIFTLAVIVWVVVSYGVIEWVM